MGTCLTVSGRLQASAGAQQDIELLADSVEIHGRMDDVILREILFKNSIINLQDHPYYNHSRHEFAPGTLRQNPHLRPATSAFQRILRARSAATLALHQYLQVNFMF